MKIGMVGAGRMGAGMVARLLKGGLACVVYDPHPAAVAALVALGAEAASSLEDLVSRLSPPRIAWMMVPSGEATEKTAEVLGAILGSGDLLVDGGNSHFKDALRRSQRLAPRGIEHVDCGTSGGVWGSERGYCLMAGCSAKAFGLIEPALKILAPGLSGVAESPGRQGRISTAKLGYLHCGGPGSGHFTKMVHNAIEYGMMQALAEGFGLMKSRASEDLDPASRYALPLADIAELWRRGSVVGSWLLDLSAMALAEDEALARFQGSVEDSGEGRWTMEAAMEGSVPAPALAAALFARYRSRGEGRYGDQLLSAMREKFGGHREKP